MRGLFSYFFYLETGRAGVLLYSRYGGCDGNLICLLFQLINCSNALSEAYLSFTWSTFFLFFFFSLFVNLHS